MKAFLVSLCAGLCVAPWSSAADLADVVFDYSLDIGGDLDLSDPITPGNNFSDAGDIYIEPPGPFGGAIKDDSSGATPGFPLAGTVPGFETGMPAQQPLSPPPPAAPTFTVGGGLASPVTPTPTLVRLNYNNAFDLDATDQLGLALPAYQGPTPGFESPILLGMPRDEQAQLGLTFDPNHLLISFDDDTAPGWYLAPSSVPTTSGPNHGDAVRTDEILAAEGGLLSGFAAPVGIRDEASLGLGTNPSDLNPQFRQFDDDVDALDTERNQFHYFSVDHEANYSTYVPGGAFFADPGSIYMTDLFIPGGNQVKILDDTINFGLPADTDVDAFEFASVSIETFITLFGYDPAAGAEVDVLIGLFSVDNNDPDNDIPGLTDDLHGDESGGLLPGVIYASDLVSSFSGVGPVAVAGFNEDVDALGVLHEVADLCGDYNDNGLVEQGDLDLVLLNWGVDTAVTGVPAGWLNTLGLTGLVDQAELDKVLLNWGVSASEPDAASVPEPAALTLLLAAWPALMRRPAGRRTPRARTGDRSRRAAS